MPLAMRNLAIAQQRDVERYNLVRGGGWDRPKASFSPGDYAMIRQKRDGTLDAHSRPHVLRVVEVKPSGVVLMEGSDAQRGEEQAKNVAQCPLPILNTRMYLGRFFRAATKACRTYGSRKRGSKMVLCDVCQDGFHIWCLDQPLLRVPTEPWKCKFHKGNCFTPS